MGRAVKDAKLDKRDARLKLAPQKEPYWRLVSEGAHLGYYRGERVGKWVARFRKPGSGGGYLKTTLGEADDVRDADGNEILNFRQADGAARLWFENQARGGVKAAGPFTVSDALDEYSKSFTVRTGAIPTDMKSRIEIIRPVLGSLEVANLTQTTISDWFNARASSQKWFGPRKVRSPAPALPTRRKRCASADRQPIAFSPF